MKCLLSILVLVAISGVFCQPASDKVTKLPGFIGVLPFDAYAGYLSANDGKKQMFYFFAESQNDPANDPVVLWLNGGPGCSSFDGFVYEHGPFTFNSGPEGAGQNLTLNPYSWNTLANMIYLDSPCGVGLSYSTDPNNDYVTNDVITAHDSHNFLLNFFTAFPSFQDNDFYIAGESYAGIYVPTLAQQVMLGNSNKSNTLINMKGILVGNGVTDQVFDGNAWVPFIYGHSLISDGLYSQLIEYCGSNFWNNSNDDCNNLLGNASDLTSSINIYNIYEDCYQGPDPKGSRLGHNLWYRITQRIRDAMGASSVGEQVPCIDSSRATNWINQNDVRAALHAIPISQVNWTICSGAITYTSIYTTVIPIHQALLKGGYREFIYSGDTDMCVPNTGTEGWTDSLNLPLVADWQPWFVNSQVAGYVRAYNQLTYATIKGSGHMVPQFKPAQSLYFFQQFLNDQPL